VAEGGANHLIEGSVRVHNLVWNVCPSPVVPPARAARRQDLPLVFFRNCRLVQRRDDRLIRFKLFGQSGAFLGRISRDAGGQHFERVLRVSDVQGVGDALGVGAIDVALVTTNAEADRAKEDVEGREGGGDVIRLATT
jgi:hypothetical protein